MSNPIYKQVELTGTSETSIEDAVERAIKKAAMSLRDIHWFQVIETRGAVSENQTIQWQVIVKVAFKLEE